MDKQEFLGRLRRGLSGLPKDDAEERLAFYSEMIEDRMEEGLSEEEAVAAAGTVEEIVAQAVAETPLAKIAKERLVTERRLGLGAILLIALGSPIWLSLGIAVLAVVLSVYVSLWAMAVSLWAVFASLIACFISCVVAWAVLLGTGNGPAGAVTLAVGLVCAGLAVFLFFGCKAATKGLGLLAQKVPVWIKNCFVKKEGAQ